VSRFVRSSLDKVSRPLRLPARRDRPLLLQCADPDRIFLTFFFNATPPRSSTAATTPAGGGAVSTPTVDARPRFSVRAGLVMRQIHTGRRCVHRRHSSPPLAGCSSAGRSASPGAQLDRGRTMLILAIFNGFGLFPARPPVGTGLRSPSRSRVDPLVGTWIAFLVFGGEFPPPDHRPAVSDPHADLSPPCWWRSSASTWPWCGARNTPVPRRRPHRRTPSKGRSCGPPTHEVAGLFFATAAGAVLRRLSRSTGVATAYTAQVSSPAQPTGNIWLEGALAPLPAVGDPGPSASRFETLSPGRCLAWPGDPSSL